MDVKLGGDGSKRIYGGMFVVVDRDSPKPNTSPVEYKELAASAYTVNKAWDNYNEERILQWLK